MTDDESKELLSAISQKLTDHIDRFAEDREDRRIWREEINGKFDGIERRIAPVILHHQIITKGGTWVVAGLAGVFGTFKAWFFIKDHLKP